MCMYLIFSYDILLLIPSNFAFKWCKDLLMQTNTIIFILSWNPLCFRTTWQFLFQDIRCQLRTFITFCIWHYILCWVMVYCYFPYMFCMNIEYCNLMSVSLFLYNKTCVKRITEQNVRCLFHKNNATCLKLLHESM